MTSYDLTPLLRSSVGFDVFDNIFDSVFNLNESSTSYPPYNIIKSKNNYTITMAIAGFTKNEVDISLEEIGLVVNEDVQRIITEQRIDIRKIEPATVKGSSGNTLKYN